MSLIDRLKKIDFKGLEFKGSFAIVGNSGRLVGQGFGEAIDEYDNIIRFNQAPTEGYEADVGSKKTIRIINTHVFEVEKTPKMIKGLTEKLPAWDKDFYLGCEGETILIKGKMPQDSEMLHKIAEKNSVVCIPNELLSLATSACRANPTCGLIGLLVALKWAQNTSCYGFGFHQEDWADRHYFEDMQPYNQKKHHEFGLEEQFFLLAEKSGLTTLF